uniref:Uncharacterized protein n=1 Tax=Triticum urartu TaxID=4572 RepID=A0A8R7PJS8_TRIUA
MAGRRSCRQGSSCKQPRCRCCRGRCGRRSRALAWCSAPPTCRTRIPCRARTRWRRGRTTAARTPTSRWRRRRLVSRCPSTCSARRSAGSRCLVAPACSRCGAGPRTAGRPAPASSSTPGVPRRHRHARRCAPAGTGSPWAR